jgi:hypothetical protein
MSRCRRGGLLGRPQRTAIDSPCLPLPSSGNQVRERLHAVPLTLNLRKLHGGERDIRTEPRLLVLRLESFCVGTVPGLNHKLRL